MSDLKKHITQSGIVLGIVAILFVIAAAINVYARQSIVHTVVSAVKKGDINELNQRTNWEELRAGIKQDLKVRANSVFGQTSGYGLSDQEIENLVEFYIRPSHLPLIFYYHSQFAPDIDPQKFIRDVRFIDYNTVVMDLGYPEQEGQKWISSLEPVQVTFRLDKGMTWRLTDVDAPLYLVPRHAPEINKETGAIVPASKQKLRTMAQQTLQNLKEKASGQ